jgi:hypothetical protein
MGFFSRVLDMTVNITFWCTGRSISRASNQIVMQDGISVLKYSQNHRLNNRPQVTQEVIGRGSAM